jgi:hypothetical protein
MVNSLNIEFSKGALTVLSNQTENKQDAILAAILKAASKDLSVLTKQSLQYVNESDIYILDVGSKLNVIFKHIENKVHIVDIMNSEIMDTFNEQVLDGTYKKFNIQEMMQAFKELTEMGTFNHIENPFEWQSQLRDEWESRY